MRKVSVIAAILALAGQAHAADLGKPAAPLFDTPAGPLSCYAGALGGFGIAAATLKDDSARMPLGATGTTGSLTAGCDIKTSALAIGLWADGTVGDIKARIKAGTDSAELALSRQWALGARLGYYVQSSTMLFGSLGWAQATAKAESPGFEASAKLNGILIGGGLETAISGPIWFRFDAMRTLYTNSPDIAGSRVDASHTAVRAGIVVRF